MDFIQEYLSFLGSWEYLIRIFAACLCGALIGLERSRRQKEAGLRTHIILALGSALAMIVSKYGFFDVITTSGIDVDVSRVASNVITGVSFLGAGVIFVRSGSIKGLTTAAGVWATAGIGLSIGAGMYILGFCSTVILILVQVILHRFLPISETLATVNVSVTVKNKPDIVKKVKERFTQKSVYIQGAHIRKNDDDTLTIDLQTRSPKDVDFGDMLDMIEGSEDLIDLSIL